MPTLGIGRFDDIRPLEKFASLLYDAPVTLGRFALQLLFTLALVLAGGSALAAPARPSPSATGEACISPPCCARPCARSFGGATAARRPARAVFGREARVPGWHDGDRVATEDEHAAEHGGECPRSSDWGAPLSPPPIVTLDQADPTAGDTGDWVVNGLTDYDAKGEARKVYLAWFWSGAGNAYPLAQPVTTKGQTQRYDAFGRPLEKTHLDGAVTLRTVAGTSRRIAKRRASATEDDEASASPTAPVAFRFVEALR